VKKVLLSSLFLVSLFGITYSQTLYNGWISFSSSYLGDNVYEHCYKWGASTTLSSEEISNLFPSYEPFYEKALIGIGTRDFPFLITWSNPVDVQYVLGWDLIYPNNRKQILATDFLHYGMEVPYWISGSRELLFRTKGYTGVQNIQLTMDYFARYYIRPEYQGTDIPIFCDLAGTPLRVTSSFGVVPEPSTLILLGSGFLGLAGFAKYKSRKKR